MPTKTRINGENYTQLTRMVSDDIILKGLPQTAGAPAGYGDLAVVINASSGRSFSPEMFGAVANGVDDCTAAIKNAIAAAVDVGFDQNGDPVGQVVFGPGVYRITETGVFSSIPDSYRAGVKYVGAGPLNTIIWLDPSAISTSAWFYDNGGTIRSWNCTFRDMAFHGGTTWRHLAVAASNLSSKINGFRFTGPSWESAHVFDNCAFTWLDTVHEVAGTNNADTQRFGNCTVVKCRRINYINNPQSMNISWTQCYLTNIFGDFAEWASGVSGGGDLHFTGGTIVFTPDDISGTSRIFNMSAGSPSASNACVNFNGRFELRGVGALIGASGTAASIVKFDSSSFLGTTASARKVLSVGLYTQVSFDSCSFSNQGNGSIEFEITGSSRAAKQGTVSFNNSYLDRFSTLFTLSTPNNKGYFKLSDCWESQSDYTVEPFVRQINGIYQGSDLSANTGARPYETYRTNPLRSGLLPLTTGNESTLQLPSGAIITKVYIVLPAAASGSTASQYRVFVGNNDKSVVYAQSVAGAQNAGFTLNADVAVKLGTAVADRTVRVWADNGAGGTSGAGSVSPTVCNIYYQ